MHENLLKMNFNRLQYLLAVLSALLLQSTIVPAQRVLPQLPTDSRIQRGTLGCGASYYMVEDPVQKGYAQIALVQKGDSLTPSKQISPSFLSRMGVAPGPEGYLSEQDGSTVYRFHDVRCYNPEVLDSVLLYTFEKMAACHAPQAVIVSGDIDAAEMKKKMDLPAGFDLIKEEDYEQIYKWADAEANPLYPVPVIWQKEDFYRLLDTLRTAKW